MLRQCCSARSRLWIQQATRSLSTEWEHRLEALRATETSDFESLLSQYKILLTEKQPNEQIAVDSMYATYEQWKTSNETSTTASPYQDMLNVLCERHQSANGMKVLQDWHLRYTGHLDLQPPPKAYDEVVSALAQDKNAPEDALQMALELVTFLEQCNQNNLPNAKTYLNLIRIMDQASSSPDAAKLQRLTDKFFQKTPTKSLIWSLLRLVSKHLDAVDEPHAKEYHQHLLQLLKWLDHSSHLDKTAQAFLSHLDPTAGTELLVGMSELKLAEIPSGRHYITMIQKWEGNTSEQAFILQLMLKTHDTTNTDSFNHKLRAHLLAGVPDQVMRLWEDNKRNGKSVRLNTESYTLMLQALAASRENDTAMARKVRAQQAHSLLQKTLHAKKPRYQLSSFHFASVMIAWSKSPDPKAAEYCEQVYDQMLALGNMEQNQNHIVALIIAWGHSRDPRAAERVLALFQTLNNVQDQKANAAVFFALSKTSAEKLRELYKFLEDSSLNTACFTSVALSNPDMTAEVFQRHWKAYEQSKYSQQFRLDSTAYTAYAKDSQDPVEMLNHCESQAEKGLVDPPSAKLFTEVMRIYGERGDLAIAERVFQRMNDSFRSGNLAAKPDAHAVTTLIRAIAWSKAPNKVEQCQMLLDQMIKEYEGGDFGMKPTAFTYGSVLSACTTSEEPNAMDVAFRLFDKVEEPDEHIFRYLFIATSRHVRDAQQKSQMAQMVLQRCCSAGYLNESILGVLKHKIPDLYRRLLDSRQRLSIPSAWSRHVKAPVHS